MLADETFASHSVEFRRQRGRREGRVLDEEYEHSSADVQLLIQEPNEGEKSTLDHLPWSRWDLISMHL